MVRARPARRRPCRSAWRAGTSRGSQPRALGAFPKGAAHAQEPGRNHRPQEHRRVDRSRRRGPEMTEIPLIDIRDLRVLFHGDNGRITHAVDSVDLSVAKGATLGLVGESGCGKSVTSLAIMGLLSKHSAEVTGSNRCDGFDLPAVPCQTLRHLRRYPLAHMFQES